MMIWYGTVPYIGNFIVYTHSPSILFLSFDYDVKTYFKHFLFYDILGADAS